MEAIWWPLAFVIASFVALYGLRLVLAEATDWRLDLGEIRAELSDWREAWRYYIDVRAGRLDAEEEAQREKIESPHELLFREWHAVCQWESEEHAAHVRNLWEKVQGRLPATMRERSEAANLLRQYGAPLQSDDFGD